MESNIKTRVWDKFNACFWYSEKFETKLKFYTAMAELEDADNKLAREQSFAGNLVDGVPLYEGDIVECYGQNYEIKYIGSGGFGHENENKDGFTTYSTAWKIVGNIYETPELLTERGQEKINS